MLYNWRERIEKHDYVIEGVLAHPYESIQMGNGDLGASVNIYPHEIKITLAKSDVWDARFDGRPEEDVLKHDDLIRMVREKDRDLRCTWSRDGDPNADFLADRLVGSLPPTLTALRQSAWAVYGFIIPDCQIQRFPRGFICPMISLKRISSSQKANL